MKENINIEKYARLIIDSSKDFSYYLFQKFYLENRKESYDLIKMIYKISINQHAYLFKSSWKVVFGETEHVNNTMLSTIVSYIHINDVPSKDGINKTKLFTVNSGLSYSENDVTLACTIDNCIGYLKEDLNQYEKYIRNKERDILLFKINIKNNKSFTLTKILPKKLFYQLFDKIFKND